MGVDCVVAHDFERGSDQIDRPSGKVPPRLLLLRVERFEIEGGKRWSLRRVARPMALVCFEAGVLNGH